MQLHDRKADFERRGYQLLAVMGQDAAQVRKLIELAGFEAGKVGFPVLADPASTASASYGVACQVNWWGDGWSSRPAVFVLDRGGVLRYEYRSGAGRFSFHGRLMDKIHVAEDRPTAEELLGILDGLAPARP